MSRPPPPPPPIPPPALFNPNGNVPESLYAIARFFVQQYERQHGASLAVASNSVCKQMPFPPPSPSSFPSSSVPVHPSFLLPPYGHRAPPYGQPMTPLRYPSLPSLLPLPQSKSHHTPTAQPQPQEELGNFIVFSLSPACRDPSTGVITERDPIPMRASDRRVYLQPWMTRPISGLGEMPFAAYLQQQLLAAVATTATALVTASVPTAVPTRPSPTVPREAAPVVTITDDESTPSTQRREGAGGNVVTPLHSTQKRGAEESKGSEGTTKEGEPSMKKEKKVDESYQYSDTEYTLQSEQSIASPPPSTSVLYPTSLPMTSPVSSSSVPTSFSVAPTPFPPSFRPLATSTPLMKETVTTTPSSPSIRPIPAILRPFNRRAFTPTASTHSSPMRPPAQEDPLPRTPRPILSEITASSTHSHLLHTPNTPVNVTVSSSPLPTMATRGTSPVRRRSRSRTPTFVRPIAHSVLSATPLIKQETSTARAHAATPRPRGRPPGSLNRKFFSTVKKESGPVNRRFPIRESTRLACLRRKETHEDVDKTVEEKKEKKEETREQQAEKIQELLRKFFVKTMYQNKASSQEEMKRRYEEIIKGIKKWKPNNEMNEKKGEEGIAKH